MSGTSNDPSTCVYCGYQSWISEPRCFTWHAVRWLKFFDILYIIHSRLNMLDNDSSCKDVRWSGPATAYRSSRWSDLDDTDYPKSCWFFVKVVSISIKLKRLLLVVYHCWMLRNTCTRHQQDHQTGSRGIEQELPAREVPPATGNSALFEPIITVH